MSRPGSPGTGRRVGMEQIEDTTAQMAAESSPDVFRANLVIHTVLPDMLLLDVPLHRFPHVVGVLAEQRGVGGVVAIVVLHNAVDAIAHALVEGDGLGVGAPHEEVDEPGVVGVGSGLEVLGEQLADAEAAGGGCDGYGGDVRVPGEVVL